MNQWLSDVLSRVESGALLGTAFFTKINLDQALDERDHDAPFEKKWLDAWNSTEATWKTMRHAEGAESLASRITKEVFLRASRATTQHEIAAYLSEDFELIVRDKILSINNPFVVQLWKSYEAGILPTPSALARCA